jgi:NADPH-dependent 2,4-dienoyl-CoA reductase/sulfur reductase-like enzyme
MHNRPLEDDFAFEAGRAHPIRGLPQFPSGENMTGKAADNGTVGSILVVGGGIAGMQAAALCSGLIRQKI